MIAASSILNYSMLWRDFKTGPQKATHTHTVKKLNKPAMKKARGHKFFVLQKTFLWAKYQKVVTCYEYNKQTSMYNMCSLHVVAGSRLHESPVNMVLHGA